MKSAIESLTSAGTGKFKIARGLVMLSAKEPEALIAHFDAFVTLLEAKNNVIKWSAFQIVANLAVADKEERIEAILDRYLAPIAGPVMITAANAICGSAIIAKSHRHLTERIVHAILWVESATYQTDECRNIAIGHAIKALGTMEKQVRQSGDVVAFVERQKSNSRPATRKKAERFLKEAKEESSNGRIRRRSSVSADA